MAEFVEDFQVWPQMVKLAACLCTTIEERGLPTPCVCSPVPGPQAVLDYCGTCGSDKDKCGGQAWVRLASAFASSTFPNPDQVALCNAPMAYALEVGIARCQPVGKANGINGYQPPTMDQLVTATRLQTADMAAIRAAVSCCLDDGDLTYSLGQYTPLPISGDCGGGFFTVTIWSV